jgi:hypothetical protein
MNEKHGQIRHPIYTSWRAMRRRCNSPSSDQWRHYGGRGIQICHEWESFPAFMAWALSAGWKPGLTIERVNVDGNYEPSNCKWATPLEQSVNRRAMLPVEVDGLSFSVLQWSKKTGIPQATLYKRYHAGIRGSKFIARPVNPATRKETPEIA